MSDPSQPPAPEPTPAGAAWGGPEPAASDPARIADVATSDSPTTADGTPIWGTPERTAGDAPDDEPVWGTGTSTGPAWSSAAGVQHTGHHGSFPHHAGMEPFASGMPGTFGPGSPFGVGRRRRPTAQNPAAAVIGVVVSVVVGLIFLAMFARAADGFGEVDDFGGTTTTCQIQDPRTGRWVDAECPTFP